MTAQTLQLMTWFLATLAFVLGMYVVVLNPKHDANRYLGSLLGLLSLNSIGFGIMLTARSVAEGTWGTRFMSITTVTLQPMTFITAIVLLKPAWLRGKWHWMRWVANVLIFMPMILALVDVVTGVGMWYTGLSLQTYAGGYVGLSDYAEGMLSLPIRIVGIYVMSLFTLLPPMFVAVFDKQSDRKTRRLAWLMLIAQLSSFFGQFVLRRFVGSVGSVLFIGVVLISVYGYAAFQQLVSERRAQSKNLQARLTLLIVVITVPFLSLVATVSQLSGLRATWAVVVVALVSLVLLTNLTIRQAFQPIRAMTEMANAIAAGDFTRTASVETEDEFGVMARAFNSMTEQLRELIGGLEQNVRERTADLERRSSYLEASAEVGRVASSILDPQELIGSSVDLIRERFGLYYVALFLVDAAGKWAILQAGTGEAGRAMLARGHRIEIGIGMIGWSVANAEARIASRAEADAVRVVNPELPETRSEAALPLRSRGRVLGALSVQSDQTDAFDEDTITVLQTMADQVAVALDNARLFAESEAALAESRRAYGELSSRAWGELLRSRSDLGYRYASSEISSVQEAWSPEMRQARRTGQCVWGVENGMPTLSVPIPVRDRVLGVLNFNKGEAGASWTNEEIALLETLAEQLGQALEGARLYHETQQRAAREQLVGEVTSRMRESLDVDMVLQTTVREIRQAMGLHDITVRLSDPGESGQH
jgi:GAF domain-containing protein